MEVTLDLVLVETEEGAREKGTSSREHTHGKGRGAGEFAKASASLAWFGEWKKHCDWNYIETLGYVAQDDVETGGGGHTYRP